MEPINNTASTTTAKTYTITSPSSYWSEKGWECPRCGRINAPWVRQCDCSRNNWKITDNDSTTSGDDWWKQYINSDTFRIHPDTVTYTNAHNSTTGGSDYWDEFNKIWSNILAVFNTKE